MVSSIVAFTLLTLHPRDARAATNASMLSVSLFGAPTRQAVAGGSATTFPLPGAGQKVGVSTMILVHCFLRAGRPTLSAPMGWSIFMSVVDNYDAQYLVYKLYPANSTIESSVVLNFAASGISYAAIEGVAYQGVSGIDAGPLETHSTNLSASTAAPSLTTTNDGDKIVGFFTEFGNYGWVDALSGGTIQSQLDNGSAPRNYYGCMAVGNLDQATHGTVAAPSLTCSSAESLTSGISVALRSLPAATQTPTPLVTPSAVPTQTPVTTVSLVQHCYGEDRVGNGETSASIALCSSPTNGHLILIQVVANGQTFTSQTLPIIPPSGYTQIRADYFNSNSPSSGSMAEFYHLWQSGDPTTVSFSFSTPVTPNWSVSEWSGYDATNPIGATVTQGTNAVRESAVTVPSLTLQSSGSAVVMYAGGESYYGNAWVSHPASEFSMEEAQIGDGVVGMLDFALMNLSVSPTGTAVDTVAIPIYNIGVLMEIQSASGVSNPTPISSPSASSAPTPTATTAGDPSPIPTPTSSQVLSPTTLPTTSPSSNPTPGAGGAFPLESGSVIGSATGVFHTQLIGDRWWMIAPDGHADFIRSLSKIDTVCCSDEGAFSSYDMVALQPNGASPTVLTEQVQDSNTSDVVVGGATLKAVGDAIVFGAANFKPNYTYFWLSTLGSGGRIQWSYLSSAGTWKPINGTGQPASAIVPDSAQSYSMDVGGYYAPDSNGFMSGGNPNADRVTWWATGKPNVTPWPADFTPQVINTLDSKPRSYIQGVVTSAFSTPPVLSQLYERHTYAEFVEAKYGGSTGNRTPYIRWMNNAISKMVGWGLNAAGQYSYSASLTAGAVGDGGVQTQPIPLLVVYQFSDYPMRSNPPIAGLSPIKNIYGQIASNPICPDTYAGTTADVFDPNFAAQFATGVAQSLTGSASPSRYYGMVPEEADDLFGIDSTSHAHMGFVVLAANPYMTSDPVNGIAYTDPTYYAKYALQRFLQGKYGTGSVGLKALNKAWGTTYTTWDTSSGSVAAGTNAWGTGTGFLDENGKGVYKGPSACGSGTQIQYNMIANNLNSIVYGDLNGFVTLWEQTYALSLSKALSGTAHPPIFEPLYTALDSAYQTLAPYVDGFWVSPVDATDAQRIMNDAQKPLIVGDYTTAEPDSQEDISGAISAVNVVGDNTVLTVPGLKYWLPNLVLLQFPDLTGATGSCQYYPNPRVVSQGWNNVAGSKLTISGNYSCLPTGTHLYAYYYGAVTNFTQQARAVTMITYWNSMINLTDSAGRRDIVGLEHWAFFDEGVGNTGSNRDFGFFTPNDNPYDGVSAVQTAGVDANGYPTGGEERNYGDLLTGSGGLGTWLSGIYSLLK
jgi:hypothetical protein